MDYDVLAGSLNGILKNCGFIYNDGDRPATISIDDFNSMFRNDDVELFEQRSLSCAKGLKKWDDLTRSEQKKLVDYLNKLNEKQDSESCLAVDLILYTMQAPGYAELDRSPGYLNDINSVSQYYGSYSNARLNFDYHKAFSNLKSNVVAQYNANDPEYADQNGWTSLMDAIQQGDNKRVRSLIKDGADINALTSSRYILIKGNTRYFKQEDAVEASKLTPLIVAVRMGNVDAVRILLENNVDLSQEDTHGNTALQWAETAIELEDDEEIKNKLIEIKKLLEDAQEGKGLGGSELDVTIDDKVNDFLIALEDGQKDRALEIFNQYKNDPEFLNFKDEDGNPLWSYVLEEKVPEVTSAFLNSDADLKAKTALGQTPMHYVLRYGETDYLSVLLEKGLDINAKDKDKQTPLHRICDGETAVETIEAFIKNGADVNPKDKDGYTPLDLVYEELNALVAQPEGISQADLNKYKSYIDILLKNGAKSSEVQLSEEAQKALGLSDPQPEDEKPTLEEFFTELRKAEINHEAVNALLEKGAAEYINETDPIKEGPTKGLTPLAIAVNRGDVQLVKTVITKGADVNKKSNDQAPLQLALQQLEEAKKTEDAAKIEAAEEIVKLLKDAGAKEEEKKPEEVQVVEVDSLKRSEGESLSDWYARVAAYWGEQEAKLRTQLENEQDADKKKAISTQAEHQKKLAELYTTLYEKENQLANETDPEKRKKLLAEMTRLSSSLLSGIPAYYKTHHAGALAEGEHPLSVQMKNQSSEVLKAANAYQKEALALSQSVRKGPKPTEISGGGSGVHGSQDTEVSVGTPPTTPTTTTGLTGVTPALIDSVAQAKHDGAQEKSWWERNQEWIWWVLGIIVVSVLGYFGFREGGWFNKKKKKTTTVASNTNENTSTNTNTNTNEGTGNTNTGTNTGNTDTNTGTNNDTLASSGRLYSAKEVNDAIAANAQNIINTRG